MARALTVKQRRFVAGYVRSGNGTSAALAAYDTNDPRTAHSIAVENLQKPAIHAAVRELFDANGLSDRKLTEIHAHYLALYQSDNPQEKALGLKALDMAYRLKGAYAAPEVVSAAENLVEATIQAFARRKAARRAIQQVLPHKDGECDDSSNGASRAATP